MSAADPAALEQLIERVVADRALHERVLAAREPAAFRSTVVAIATELGLSVDAQDVEDGLRVARQWWLQRWV